MVFGALRIKTKTAALVATKGTFPYAFDGSDGDDRDTKRTSQKKFTRLYSFTPFSLHVMLNKVKKNLCFIYKKRDREKASMYKWMRMLSLRRVWCVKHKIWNGYKKSTRHRGRGNVHNYPFILNPYSRLFFWWWWWRWRRLVSMYTVLVLLPGKVHDFFYLRLTVLCSEDFVLKNGSTKRQHLKRKSVLTCILFSCNLISIFCVVPDDHFFRVFCVNLCGM